MDGPCRSIPRRKRTPIYIAKGKPGAPKTVVRVSEQKDEITVNTGAIVCKLGKSGPALIRSISISGEMMAKEGRLIALKEKAVQIHKACIILNGLRAWSNVRQSNKTVRSRQSSRLKASTAAEASMFGSLYRQAFFLCRCPVHPDRAHDLHRL